MANSPLPSPDQLRQLLRYDPDTGKLFWLDRIGQHRWNGKHAGKEALRYVNKFRYKNGTVLNHFVLAHRVAWAVYYGEWPKIVDHIDGDKGNNKLENLRSVTKKENSRNMPRCATNKSGFTGVHWRPNQKKWTAQIRIDGKSRHLGYYVSIEDAVQARTTASLNNGFHPNHGRS